MINQEKVEEILDRIRPAIQSDGGDVELIKIREDGVIEVRLQGACKGCPMAALTLKAGIEGMLKRMVPEVTEVIQEME